MPKVTYGKTPWGASFLASLTALDTGGRLARGKTIANTGKVLSFSAQGSTIKARVKGSFAPHYDVAFTFRAFDGAEREKVFAVVEASPVLLGALIGGDLPVELLKTLTAAGVTPLPRSWAEISPVTCTCPDFQGGGGYRGGSALAAGSPCKHISAAYFLLVNEVDRDPFTLFRLRGLALQERFALAEGAADAVAYPLPSCTVVTAPPAQPTTNEAVAATGNGEAAAAGGADDDDAPPPPEAEERPLERIPLPALAPGAAFVLSCLAQNPPFCTTHDYHAVLHDFYAAAAKRSAGLFSPPPKALDGVDPDRLARVLTRAAVSLQLPRSWSVGARVEVRSDLLADANGDGGGTLSPADVFGTQLAALARPLAPDADSGAPGGVSFDLLTGCQLLMAVPEPSSGTAGAARGFHFLRGCADLAVRCLGSCNFVPAVVPLGEDLSRWRVLWRPLASTPGVGGCAATLERAYPCDEAGAASGAQAGPCVLLDGQPLDARSAVQHAVAAVVTAGARGLKWMHAKGKARPPAESLAFFGCDAYTVLAPSMRSVAPSVSKWLKVFDLMSLPLEMEVSVQEQGDGDQGDGGDDNLEAGGRQFGVYDYRLLLALKQQQPEQQQQAQGQQGQQQAQGEQGQHAQQRQQQPLCDFLPAHPQQRPAVLKLLAAISASLPCLDTLMRKCSASLSGPDFERFILDHAAMLGALGVRLTLPKGLDQVLRPRAVVRASNGNGKGAPRSFSNFLDMQKLLQFDWAVALGADEVMSPDEFRRLAASGRRLVRFRGRYVQLEGAQVADLIKTVSGGAPKPPTAHELLRASLDEEGGCGVGPGGGDGPPLWLGDLRAGLRGLTHMQPQPVPAGLNAQLREYQERGFQWAASLLGAGLGAVLADDMGLGKTVQAIATILGAKHTGLAPGLVLVVAPTSLLTNWQREIARFAPALRVVQHYGADRAGAGGGDDGAGDDGGKRTVKRRKTGGSNGPPAGTDVVLTSYGTMRRDVGVLKSWKIDMCIIDEAQAIKNHSSQVSKAIKSLSIPLRLALSGTPVENRLSELWSLLEWALPGYLGTLKDFNNSYAKPIEANRDAGRLASLRRVTAPFVLRRLKSDRDIIRDLPDKVVQDVYSTLAPGQAALYHAVVAETMAKIEEVSERKKAGLPAGNRGGLVFSLLTALKQVCNHPATYKKTVTGANNGGGNGSGNGSGGNGGGPNGGSGGGTSANGGGGDAGASVYESGKCRLLMDTLQPVIDAGGKVLVFTQYVAMLSLLDRQMRSALAVAPVCLTGAMSRKERDAAVTRFQTDPSAQVFLISLKAGGVGLNLTAANHVVHFDLWWNPAVESQATDRAFRIGQQRTVFVTRFITKGTFEEKINDMITKKRELSDLSMAEGETWLSRLSDAELRDLVAL